jgi:tRNA threonylcarbamoyladenosine biosynthesis protein TsaB
VRILALDTTREFGSLALVDSGNTVEEILIHSPDGFSPILFERIDRLLRMHAWALESLDCYAAGSGPGSFTGLRVGLAAVKGLAEAAGKPAIGVSNLQALALFGSEPVRATMIDARRGEIYAAVYDAELRPAAHECVARFPEWLNRLPEGVSEFIAMDSRPFLSSLEGTRFGR